MFLFGKARAFFQCLHLWRTYFSLSHQSIAAYILGLYTALSASWPSNDGSSLVQASTATMSLRVQQPCHAQITKPYYFPVLNILPSPFTQLFPEPLRVIYTSIDSWALHSVYSHIHQLYVHFHQLWISAVNAAHHKGKHLWLKLTTALICEWKDYFSRLFFINLSSLTTRRISFLRRTYNLINCKILGKIIAADINCLCGTNLKFYSANG